MRNVNCTVLSAAATASANGVQIDTNQLVSISFHAVFGDAAGAGTIKLQASNDIATSRNMVAIDGFVVTNWVDIPNQSATIVAGAPALLTIGELPYRWMRVVFTRTGGTTTVRVNMNALST